MVYNKILKKIYGTSHNTRLTLRRLRAARLPVLLGRSLRLLPRKTSSTVCQPCKPAVCLFGLSNRRQS